MAESRASEALRKRVRIVGEETYGIFDPFKGSKPTPLPPGNVIYTEGFTDVCDKMIGKEERSDLYNDLSYYIERILNRVNEYDTTEGRKSERAWSPEKSPEYCCSQCGLNHEARDFLRAVFLRLIDQFQSSRKFIEILKTNGFISQGVL